MLLCIKRINLIHWLHVLHSNARFLTLLNFLLTITFLRIYNQSSSIFGSEFYPTFVNDDEKLKGSGNQRPPTRYPVFSLPIAQGRLFNQFFKYHSTRCALTLFSLFFNMMKTLFQKFIIKSSRFTDTSFKNK